jgi:hypothetical protein
MLFLPDGDIEFRKVIQEYSAPDRLFHCFKFDGETTFYNQCWNELHFTTLVF